MPFVFIILTRVLFIVSMVFIIGYVFGGFSKSATLSTLTKVAVVLAIVLFIGNNIFSFRMARWGYAYRAERGCVHQPNDTTRLREWR